LPDASRTASGLEALGAHLGAQRFWSKPGTISAGAPCLVLMIPLLYEVNLQGLCQRGLAGGTATRFPFITEM